jgi:trimeric autotransporter adhesin
MRAALRKTSVVRSAVITFLMGALSCGGGGGGDLTGPGGGVVVTQITVSPDAGTIVAGQTMTFSAQPKDASGNPVNQAVIWSTSDPSVATVALGVVTAVKPGTTTLRAANGLATGSATITVIPAIAEVVVTPTPTNVVINTSAQLTATLHDAAGATIPIAGRTVTWSSSSDAIATVSATGSVTGKALGTATITATAEGKSGTATVVVTNIPVASVTITPLAGALTVGDTKTLTPITKDDAGNVLTGRAVTWTSSDPAVASIIPNTGVLTAKAPGTATITASSEGKTGTLLVTVAEPQVASIAVSPGSVTVAAGKTTTLTATLTDGTGKTVTGPAVTWSTSDATKAAVSSSGVVSALSAGAVTITASSQGKTATSAVTVVDLTAPHILSITVPATVDVASGAQTITLTATITDAGGSGVQSVDFAATAPTGAPYTCKSTTPATGTPSNGTWSCQITIPTGAAGGDWIVSLVAFDAALNRRALSSGDLAAAGLPSKFRVVSPTEDKTTPALVGALGVTPTSVDVTTGAKTIAVEAHLTDNGSGVARFEFIAVSPSGNATVGCSASVPVLGSPADGTWKCMLTIPAGVEAGSWTTAARAIDATLNTLILTPGPTITVASAPDIAAPAFAAFSVSPATVDVSTGAQVVTATARLTDAGSGVASFAFSAIGPDNTAAQCNATHPTSGTPADGVWSCQVTIPPGVAAGDWMIAVQATDSALNRRPLGTAELNAASFPTKVTVISP